MRLWPLLVLALTATASAQSKKKNKPPMTQTPAVDQCAQEKVEGFQIRTGYASDTDSATAIRAAKLNARKNALDSLCAEVSDTRCARLGRHVEDAKPAPFYNPSTTQACAHVGVNRKYLDLDQAEMAAFDAALKTLAKQVAENGALLVFRPPVWSQSGCNVGELGAAILSEIHSGLQRTGARVVNSDSADATVVQLRLTLKGDQISLTVGLEQPEQTGELPLGGFSFSADLFDLGAGLGDCRFDTELGLAQGVRDGDPGRLRLDVGATGVFCEGDKIAPRMYTPKEAVVKVYSVSKDGASYLVWPPPGQSGQVSGWTALDEMTLLLTPDLSDEKMVMVAVPVGKDFGPHEGFSGFCQTSSPFSADSYADGASVVSASFKVLPFDASSCVRRDVASSGAMALPEVAICR